MSADMTDPIQAVHNLFNEACKSGSVDDIVSMLAEDCVFMPQNETSLYGSDEVREWYDEYYQHFQITALTDTERDVTLLGDWALERYAYSVAILPVRGGDRIRDDGRFLVAWTKDATGDWKISQYMFNSVRPIGSGTSRFMVRMMERRKSGTDTAD